MGWQTNENVTNYYKQKLAQIDTPPARPQVIAIMCFLPIVLCKDIYIGAMLHTISPWSIFNI